MQYLIEKTVTRWCGTIWTFISREMLYTMLILWQFKYFVLCYYCWSLHLLYCTPLFGHQIPRFVSKAEWICLFRKHICVNAMFSILGYMSPQTNTWVCGIGRINAFFTNKTYLLISDPPPNIVEPPPVSVVPGNNAMLTCLAYSTVEFNLTWYRASDGLDLHRVRNARVHSNGSVELMWVQPLLFSLTITDEKHAFFLLSTTWTSYQI